MPAPVTKASEAQYAKEVLHALGIHHATLTTLCEAGRLRMTHKTPGAILEVVDENEEVTAGTTVLVKGAVLSALISGGLGQSSKEVTRNVILMSLSKLTEQAGWPYDPIGFWELSGGGSGVVEEDTLDTPPSKKEGSVIGKASDSLLEKDENPFTAPVEPPPKKNPAQPKKKAESAQSGMGPPIPVEIPQIKKSNPVLLKHASQLYQPVQGSSTGSVYHVVGFLQTPEGLIAPVAVRLKKTTPNVGVSVRVEGDEPAMNSLHPGLDAAGFSCKTSPHGLYASLHMTSSEDMVSRVCAAMLFSIGAHVAQIAPSFEAVVDQGAG